MGTRNTKYRAVGLVIVFIWTSCLRQTCFARLGDAAFAPGIANASHICTARLSRYKVGPIEEEGGDHLCFWIMADLVVERAIKGKPEERIEVRLRRGNVPAGSDLDALMEDWSALERDRRYLLFLSRLPESAAYTLTGSYGYTPIGERPPLAKPDELQIDEYLELEFISALNSTNRDVCSQNLRILRTWRRKSEAILRALTTASARSEVRIKALAVSTRLCLGDPTAVAEVPPDVPECWIDAGIHAALGEIRDERAIPGLIALVRSHKNTLVRVGAIVGLRGMIADDNKSVLRAVFVKALQDAERGVQYEAIGALYFQEKLGKGKRWRCPAPLPAREVFLKDPERVIRLWREVLCE